MSLTIENVTYQAGNKTVVHDVSCRFADGSLTLIVGQTGSGKSTLLYVMAGLLAPHAGKVLHESEGLHGRSDIGIAFQYPEHQLFAQTVRAEFAYSLKALHLPRGEIDATAREALRQAGLPADILERSPFDLSGGERRRLALALTLATEPAWLLLDEPTAALDARGAEWLAAMLRRRRGMPHGGVVVATHDLDAFLPLADRVLVLRDGRVAADLTPGELLRRPEVLLQARVGLPACMRLAAALSARGMAVAGAAPTPRAMAAAIAAWRRQPATAATAACAAPAAAGQAASAGVDEAPPADTNASTPPLAAGQTAATACAPLASGAATAGPAPEARPAQADVVRRLDPRAKWLIYVMLSAGILLQQQPAGLAVAAVVTSAAITLSDIGWIKLWRFVKPFFYFTLLSSVIAGIQLGSTATTQGKALTVAGIGFIPGPAIHTLEQYFKILLIMLLGLLLTWTTTQLATKQALESVLSRLPKRFRPQTEAFALGASLLLRFIPIITSEVERLAMIVKARSPRRMRSQRSKLRPADLPALAIPLLFSVMQTAEDLALAMEVRGYNRPGRIPTAYEAPSWRRLDCCGVAAGVLILAAFLLLRLYS